MTKEKVQTQNAEEPEVEPHLLAWQTGKRQLPKAKDLPPIFRELVMNAPKTLQTLVFITATPAVATYATIKLCLRPGSLSLSLAGDSLRRPELRKIFCQICGANHYAAAAG